MAEGNQDHCAIAQSPAISLCGCDQLVDLALGEMLTRPKLTVWPAQWRNCPIF
jgi:hypothetical protein